MCGQCHPELILLWQERHFPWGFNLWYIVLEIVPATFTQLEMSAIVSHQNTWGGRVPPVSSDSQVLVFRQIKISVSRGLAQSPTHCLSPGAVTRAGLLTLTRVGLHKGADMKKAKQQCKVPFRNSYLSACLSSKGHRPEWGSQLSHLWCWYCSVNVMCSNLCHVLWNGEGNHGEKI